LTLARRPDGTGGPLAADERIDDIQFYADPAADFVIDDVVLYDAVLYDAVPYDAGEAKGLSFPRQIVFTGWFDTGRQGAEWPGDFEIVPHAPPQKWKAAKAVPAPDGKSRWVRVDLRGPRPLPSAARLRFRYLATEAKELELELGLASGERRASLRLAGFKPGAWSEADVDLKDAIQQLAKSTAGQSSSTGPVRAQQVAFRIPLGGDLFVDDVLLYEPRE